MSGIPMEDHNVTDCEFCSPPEPDLDEIQARTERAAAYQLKRGGRWWSSTRTRDLAAFKAISPAVWLEVIAMARANTEKKKSG